MDSIEELSNYILDTGEWELYRPTYGIMNFELINRAITKLIEYEMSNVELISIYIDDWSTDDKIRLINEQKNKGVKILEFDTMFHVVHTRKYLSKIRDEYIKLNNNEALT